MAMYKYISPATFLILLLGFTTVLCSPAKQHRNENQKDLVGMEKPTDINPPPIYEKDPICIDGTTRRCPKSIKEQPTDINPPIYEKDPICIDGTTGRCPKNFKKQPDIVSSFSREEDERNYEAEMEEEAQFWEDFHNFANGRGPPPTPRGWQPKPRLGRKERPRPREN